MVRMKLTDQDFDPKALDVEPSQSQFTKYDGDIPKDGTTLIARVTKMWWTYADSGSSMIKLIVVAEGNTGKLKQFNGLDTWENLTWTPGGAFRYQPFLRCFGLSLTDIKRKLDVSPDDEKNGTPINSIADWEVGSDDALCRIIIKRDRYDGRWQSKVAIDGWLPYDDADEDDDYDEDDVEEDQPRTRRASKPAKPAARTTSRRRGDPDEDEDEDDEYDDDVPDDDEELDDDYDEADDEEEAEDEEEEEPPARQARPRGRTTASRAAAVRPASRTAGGTQRRDGAARRRDGGRASARTPARRGGGSKGGKQAGPPF